MRNGGRQKGSLNKVTAQVKELAGVHSADAIRTLSTIMKDSEMPPQARVMAAKELLDRAHGKPASNLALEIQQTPERSKEDRDAIIAAALADVDVLEHTMN